MQMVRFHIPFSIVVAHNAITLHKMKIKEEKNKIIFFVVVKLKFIGAVCPPP